MTMAPFALSGVPIRVMAHSMLSQTFACEDVADRVLVLVQLAGGNDGLNTLIPLDQYSQYRNIRPNIGLRDQGTGSYVQLDSTLPDEQQIGIQPDMMSLKSLYEDGKINFVQDVCYPDNNKSHFKGTDILLAGRDGLTANETSSGWFGRYLDYRFPNFPGAYPNQDMPDPLGLQLGSNTISLGFHRQEGVPTGMALKGDPSNFFYLVNSSGGLAPGQLPPGHFGEELEYVMQLEQSTNLYAGRLNQVYNSGANTVTYPTTYYTSSSAFYYNELAPQLQIVARLLSGGIKTKVFLVRLQSFDHHVNITSSASDPSRGQHAVLLYHLSESLRLFQEDLKNMGLEDRVLTLTFSEFGRTATENGSRGTDHGTSAPMILMGKGIKPGVTGLNPNLSSIQNNNFTSFQHDYRQVITTVMQDWLGAGPNSLSASELNYFSNQKLDLINSNYVDPISGTGYNYVADPGCYDGGAAPTFPVEFIRFEAVPFGAMRVRCTWATGSERNNEVFVVERSGDGFTFEAIGELPGSGNSSRVQEYTYLDEQPIFGTSYYRIRQIDFDGAFTTTEVRTVFLDLQAAMQIDCSFYPNPVSDLLNASLHTAEARPGLLRLIKLNGGEVWKQQVALGSGDNMYQIPVQHLSAGHYFVEFSSEYQGRYERVGWSKVTVQR